MLWPHDKQDKKRKIQDGETVLVYSTLCTVCTLYTLTSVFPLFRFHIGLENVEISWNIIKVIKKHNFSTLRCRKNWETYQIYPWTQCTFFTVWSITVNGLQFSITVNGFAFFPFIVKHLQEKHDNDCCKVFFIFFIKVYFAKVSGKNFVLYILAKFRLHNCKRLRKKIQLSLTPKRTLSQKYTVWFSNHILRGKIPDICKSHRIINARMENPFKGRGYVFVYNLL